MRTGARQKPASSKAPHAAATSIEAAIEAFARGFAFTRSFTHPCLALRQGSLWLHRDGPRERGDVRNEEWIACGIEPGEVDRHLRQHAQGRFGLSYILPDGAPDGPIRAAFKALGLSLRTTEFFMSHSLRRIPAFKPPTGVTIERVRTQELADRLAKSARRRQILPEHLVDDAPLRQYVAIEADRIVGWVRSIAIPAGSRRACWCSNMYVSPSQRRRGIGKALLSRMLFDDRRAGAHAAVLLASHTGAKLYPLLGYALIGTLCFFMPRRPPRSR